MHTSIDLAAAAPGESGPERFNAGYLLGCRRGFQTARLVALMSYGEEVEAQIARNEGKGGWERGLW